VDIELGEIGATALETSAVATGLTEVAEIGAGAIAASEAAIPFDFETFGLTSLVAGGLTAGGTAI